MKDMMLIGKIGIWCVDYTYRRNEQMSTQEPKHLAWHETMELHETVAFQSNSLTDFKMNLMNIKDPQLKKIYMDAIASIEQNLTELLPYFKAAPVVGARAMTPEDATAFYAAHLLIFAKTAVRNYAIAITETATPALRQLLQKQLNSAIQLHGDIFQFMYTRGLYPAYDLNLLLANDQKNAEKAMKL
jgi:spore coat protein F